MDKIAKDKPSGDLFRSHCFPVFHGVSPVNGEDDDNACRLFRPSYAHGAENGEYRPSSHLSAKPDLDEADDLSAQRSKSYHKGVIAGKNDAKCVLQGELTPGIRGLATAMNQLSDQLAHVTEASVHNIVLLAMEIAHKIIGQKISIGDERLASIKHEIQDALNSAYAINLRMNPSDYDGLSAMIKCQPDFSLSADGVQLVGDSHVSKGEFFSEEGDQPLLSDHFTRKLTHILDSPSST